MRSDTARLSTIRLLLAAMKQKEVDERVELSDADVLAIIDKMIRQRRESITQFDAGGRPELAAAERAEIEILQGYMPQPIARSRNRRARRCRNRERWGYEHGSHGQGHGEPSSLSLPGRADMAVVSSEGQGQG